MNIIGYLRTSSTNKDDHEDSIAEQKRKILAWARAHDHVVTGWFTDEGLSGGNGLESRDGLPAALAVLREKQAGGLAVSVLDRLARDLIVQETLLAEIRRLGAEPFTTSAAEAEFLADDPDDPSRRLIRQILGAVHEYERSMIAFRLRGGKAAKRARGGYAGGFVPLGKQAIDGAFVPHAGELAAMARARELRGQGMSLRAVADALNAAGVPTKHGKAWHASTVGRVIA